MKTFFGLLLLVGGTLAVLADGDAKNPVVAVLGIAAFFAGAALLLRR